MNAEIQKPNVHLADNDGQAVSRTIAVEGRRSTGAALVAGLLAAMGSSPFMRSKATPRARKPVPTMACSAPGAIAAHNDAVVSDRRDRLVIRRVERNTVRAFKDNGQAPKFAAQRVRKQHKHPLRDEHGAITLVGKRYELEGVHPSSREVVLEGWVDGDDFGYVVQRKWLAGISAQRGY